MPPLPPGFFDGAIIRRELRPVGIVGGKAIKGVTPDLPEGGSGLRMTIVKRAKKPRRAV